MDIAALLKKHVGEDGSIPASAIGNLETAIKTAVGDEFVAKDRYKAKLTEIDNLNQKLQTAEDKVTTAEKWEQKYKDEAKAFSEYKADQDAKRTEADKKAAYKSLLEKTGVAAKWIDRAMKGVKFESLKLDKDGALENSEELVKSIKDEWGDCISQSETVGASTAKPPANNGGKAMTKEEIMNIKDATERQKAMVDNHELFGL